MKRAALPPVIFVTGTDTGIGKTVFTVSLLKSLRRKNLAVAGLKPVCSGGRDDARKIFAALNGALPLDEINPWYFRAPLAPSLAARQEGKTVKLQQIITHVHRIQKRFEFVVIEGAGGLLSPLGENFDSRDLILKLRALPVIIAPNRLGVVNHILLTLEALPKTVRSRARVVFMPAPGRDVSAKTNAKLLAEYFDGKRIFSGGRLDPAVICCPV